VQENHSGEREFPLSAVILDRTCGSFLDAEAVTMPKEGPTILAMQEVGTEDFTTKP